MARSQFEIGRRYPARLARIQKRNIENRIQDLTLLRLEIELFNLDNAVLRPTGEYASRELVLFRGVASDPGVQRYAIAFGMDPAASLASWLRLNERPAVQRPWVLVAFGRPDEEDYRQPFQEIRRFDVGTYSVSSGAGQFVGELTLGKAARLLDVSENTLRRWLEGLDPRLAGSVVRHTSGGHRRIDAKLLRVLWNSRESKR